ncbi:MAG: hypothetical protein FJX65_18840 [Alphaproteobacteria bacterium]|nr:hypothetical protein [Alphaproteobacteria bacterium]
MKMLCALCGERDAVEREGIPACAECWAVSEIRAATRIPGQPATSPDVVMARMGPLSEARH